MKKLDRETFKHFVDKISNKYWSISKDGIKEVLWKEAESFLEPEEPKEKDTIFNKIASAIKDKRDEFAEDNDGSKWSKGYDSGLEEAWNTVWEVKEQVISRNEAHQEDKEKSIFDKIISTLKSQKDPYMSGGERYDNGFRTGVGFSINIINEERKKSKIEEEKAEMRRLGLCGSFEGWRQHLKDKEESSTNLSALERVENFLEGQLDENEELMATFNSENVKFWQGAVRQSGIDLEFVKNLIKEYSVLGKQEQKTKKSASEVLDEAISIIKEKFAFCDAIIHKCIIKNLPYIEMSARRCAYENCIDIIERLKKENE